MSVRGKMAVLLRRKLIRIDGNLLSTIVDRNNAQPWFKYAHFSRNVFQIVWESSFWLAWRLPSTARILETGCGCALNLIWFGQQGFRSLHGFDNDQTSIAAAKELCAAISMPAALWEDDGLRPSQLPHEQYDAIIALNWVYLVPGFDLVEFLRYYRTHLTPRGYLVLDVIDSSYNQMPNSEYSTQDFSKPESERRPTEYVNRYSRQQVLKSAEVAGLRVLDTIINTHSGIYAPKHVYILGRL